MACRSESGAETIVAPFTLEKLMGFPPKFCTCEDGTEFEPEIPDIAALAKEAATVGRQIVAAPGALIQAVGTYMGLLHSLCPGIYREHCIHVYTYRQV